MDEASNLACGHVTAGSKEHVGAEASPGSRARAPEVRGPRDRAVRLRAVGEVLGLYRDLERALRAVSDAELEQLATAARAGERALGRWARSIETFRRFKRRIEAGLPPADETRREVDYGSAIGPWIEEEENAGPPPYLWEALAFAIGFIVSFLVT